MPLKLFIVLVLCVLTEISFCQNTENLISRHSKINLDSINIVLKNNGENFVKKIQNEGPFIVTEFRKNYAEEIKEINVLCKGNYLFWDDTTAHYLNNLIYKIQAASPFIKKDIILFTTKTLVPNASSWGNNLIFINTGILTKYTNEAELAYVICHELAHDYLNHVFNASKINNTVSKQIEFSKKYRKAQRAKYQATNKLNKIVEQYLGAINKYSRKDELQADSLGAVLLVNAGYTYKNAIKSLSILETVDDAFFTDTLNLEKIFSGNDYPFNKKWLQQENISRQNIYVEKLNDSLNTHPECKNRIKVLISEFKIDTNIQSLNKSVNIDFINQKAFFEDMQFCYDGRSYLFSLYHGLQLLQKNPQNDYLVNIICGSLYHISFALKKHRFSYYVPLPHPDFDADLNSLIAFLNNLTYMDYEKITKQFYISHAINRKEKTTYLINAKFYCNAFDAQDAELTKTIKEINDAQKTSTFEDIINEIGYEKK